MKYAITYVSTATSELSNSGVEELLESCKKWNNNHKITGLLLYSDGNFLQILEGEKGHVRDLFEKIKKDIRHKNLIKIFEKEISEESFDGYDSDIVSESTKYDPMKMERYFDHIQVLDPGTQKAVKKVLTLFLNSK